MAILNALNDIQLVSLIREGDRAAFTELFERYNGLLYIYAKKVTRDKNDAEDIVQDIFVSLWHNAPTLELRSSLSSYLYSAVRYKFIDLVAKKKVRSDYAGKFQGFIEQGVYSTDHYINEKELIALVEQEVSNLPYKMREVFELSRTANLSHKEIAEQLDISEKTVRNHVNHALKILRYKVGIVAILCYLLPHH